MVSIRSQDLIKKQNIESQLYDEYNKELKEYHLWKNNYAHELE